MKQIQIPKKLYNEIKDYCSYNEIKGVNHHIVYLIELGFNFMRYGVSPFDNQVPQYIKEEEKQPIVEDVVTVKEELPKVEKQEKKEKKKGITIIKN
jgi:hypothetical protein